MLLKEKIILISSKVTLKKLREFVLFLIFFIFVVGVAALAFNWLVEVVIHQKKEIVVPDLKNKSLAESLRIVSGLGLALREEREQFDDTVPGGAVISQSPVPGILVREGKVIKVIVSQGGSKIFIPDLTGQPIRAAEIGLRNLGLAIGNKEVVYSTDVPKGIVINQDPLPGASADKGTLISLIVSQGPPGEEIVLLPDFANKEIGDVEVWAIGKGLSVEKQIEVEKIYQPQVKEGLILSQTPAPNTPIDDNTKVVIKVASATPLPGMKTTNFHYEVSQGSVEKELRIVILDKNGERTVYQSLAAPGSKLNLKLAYTPPARVRIFVNGVLMEEKELDVSSP